MVRWSCWRGIKFATRTRHPLLSPFPCSLTHPPTTYTPLRLILLPSPSFPLLTLSSPTSLSTPPRPSPRPTPPSSTFLPSPTSSPLSPSHPNPTQPNSTPRSLSPQSLWSDPNPTRNMAEGESQGPRVLRNGFVEDVSCLACVSADPFPRPQRPFPPRPLRMALSPRPVLQRTTSSPSAPS